MPASPPRGLSFLFGSPERCFVPEFFDPDSVEFRDAVRAFVDDEVLPVVDQLEKHDSVLLRSLLQAAGQMGIFSVDVPEELGGLGASKKTGLLLAEQIGRAASFAPGVLVQTGIGGLPIQLFGSDEQRAAWVPRILDGSVITAYALTEPGSGSDALGARCSARLDQERDGYILNGTKQFITNAGVADVFIVFAQVDGQHFTAFIVPRDSAGLELGPEEHKMGLHGSSTRAVILEDVLVAEGNVLGEVGKGHRIAFNILNVGRLKLAPAVLGGSKLALEHGARYVAERHQFGRALAEFPLIQQKLALSAARLYALEAMLYRTIDDVEVHSGGSEHIDRGKAYVEALREFSVECSIAKVYGSEVGHFVADEMVQVHGGYGYIAEYPVERHYRDQRINRIWEGTNEINRLLIAGTILKRAGKKEIPLRKAAQGRVIAAFRPKRGERETGPLQTEEALVEQARSIVVLAYAVAAAGYGRFIDEEQEALAWLADMTLQFYAMESALLRTRVLLETAVEYGSHLDATRLIIEEAFSAIDAAVSLLLASLRPKQSPGFMASVQMKMLHAALRRVRRREHYDVRVLGRGLGQTVVEAGGYPFGA